MGARRGYGTGLLLVIALIVAGCAGSTGNKAGGAGQSVLTLTLADGESSPQEVQGFVDAVREVSGGSMEIQVTTEWRHGEMNYEAGLITDVEQGKADLGEASARVWDTVGINNLDALLAPFLIDSYELEAKVLRSDTAAGLLDGLKAGGLVGLGYLQGPIRYPLGLTRQLVSPSDFRGARIGIRPSRLAEMTFAALGATPVDYIAGAVPTGLDGLEAHLDSIAGNRFDTGARSLTGNIDLWTRPFLLFAGAKAFDALSAAQQDMLRSAAATALEQSITDRPGWAQGSRDSLCQRGLSIVAAPDGTLAELRQEVQSVYDELEKDPQTKATIEMISSLRSTTAEALVPCGSAAPTGSPPVFAPTLLDGVWSVCFTREEYLAAGADAGEDNPDNYGCGISIFENGRFWGLRPGAPLGQPGATYVVEGNRITLVSPSDGETWEFTWSLFKDALSFKKTGPVGPTGFVVKPFQRVTGPTPLDGTYQTSFTRDELAASPLVEAGEINDGNWGDMTLTFQNGQGSGTQRNDRVPLNSGSFTYTVYGDAIWLPTRDEGTFAYRWSLYKDTLTFKRDESLGGGPTPWLVKPWTRVP
jgi:TRAP-type transport system periplasmic protein